MKSFPTISPDEPAWILFDGVCNLCHGWVRFVLRRDKAGRFRFLPRDSSHGRKRMEVHSRDSANLPDSILLETSGILYTKSEAALIILHNLGGLWSFLAAVCGVWPKSWRDTLYDWVARNRYRWFGKKPACPIPPQEWRERLYSGEEPHE